MKFLMYSDKKNVDEIVIKQKLLNKSLLKLIGIFIILGVTNQILISYGIGYLGALYNGYTLTQCLMVLHFIINMIFALLLGAVMGVLMYFVYEHRDTNIYID